MKQFIDAVDSVATRGGNRGFGRFSAVLVLAVLLVLALPGLTSTAHAKQRGLDHFESKYYDVYTNLRRNEAQFYARHMDRVFDEYASRFQKTGLRSKIREKFALYLMDSAEDYMKLLQSHGVTGSNTGGMFVYQRDFRGLITYTDNRSVSDVFAVLQHEGFHQFAFTFIGPDLPIWVNEGIAQYFEDGIKTPKRMLFDIANGKRLAIVQNAIENGSAIDFDRILTMTNGEWLTTLATNPQSAGLLYQQAWSMAFFLINGDNGKYRSAFERYLIAVGKGVESAKAFSEAFGVQNTDPFRKAWERWVESAEPDERARVMSNLEFLAQALIFMNKNDMKVPGTTAALQDMLADRNFRLTRTSNNLTISYDASDESLYRYENARGGTQTFQIWDPRGNDLLHRVSAPGMRPAPTLEWYRNDGKLFYDVIWK